MFLWSALQRLSPSESAACFEMEGPRSCLAPVGCQWVASGLPVGSRDLAKGDWDARSSLNAIAGIVSTAEIRAAIVDASLELPT